MSTESSSDVASKNTIDPLQRAKLIRQRGGSGRWLYLREDDLRDALPGPIPEDLWASRVVFQRGKRQLLIRLYPEP